MIGLIRITLCITLVVSFVNGAVLNRDKDNKKLSVLVDPAGKKIDVPKVNKIEVINDSVKKEDKAVLSELSLSTDSPDDASSPPSEGNLADDMLVLNDDDDTDDEGNDDSEISIDVEESEDDKSDKKLNALASKLISEIVNEMSESNNSEDKDDKEDGDDVETIQINESNAGSITVSETIRDPSHPESGTITISETINPESDDDDEGDDETSTVPPPCEGDNCDDDEDEEIKQTILITKTKDKNETGKKIKNDDGQQEQGQGTKIPSQKEDANDEKSLSNLMNGIDKAIESSKTPESDDKAKVTQIQDEENEDETEDDKMTVKQFNPLNEELQLFPIE